MRAIDINFSDRLNGTVKYLSLNLSFLCEWKLLEMCILILRDFLIKIRFYCKKMVKKLIIQNIVHY